MSDDLKIPHPPEGFVYERSMSEWTGLDAYADDRTLGGVWSDWNPEQGVTITLDPGRTTMTLAEFETLVKLYADFAAKHKEPQD